MDGLQVVLKQDAGTEQEHPYGMAGRFKHFGVFKHAFANLETLNFEIFIFETLTI